MDSVASVMTSTQDGVQDAGDYYGKEEAQHR
jgi:hypothetical protein